MHLTEIMERVAQAFEMFGALVLVLGLVWSVVLATRAWRSTGGRQAYVRLRQTFGGALLLGIEILVAADLIRTVAVTATLESVAALGLIVLIRTFLSFSLDVEIDGTLPWRRPTPARSTAPRTMPGSASGDL